MYIKQNKNMYTINTNYLPFNTHNVVTILNKMKDNKWHTFIIGVL